MTAIRLNANRIIFTRHALVWLVAGLIFVMAALVASPARGGDWKIMSRDTEDPIYIIDAADSTPREKNSQHMLGGKPVVQTGSNHSGGSAWSRVASMPRRMFNGAKNALSFGKNDQPKVVSSYSPPKKTAKKSTAKKSPGFFGSLFASNEPKEPRTPQEWLEQDRPNPFE